FAPDASSRNVPRVFPAQEPLSDRTRHPDGRRTDLEAPGPAAPPPGYAPYPTSPPMPPRGVSMNTLVLLSGILLGALVFVGTLSFHAVFLIPAPGTPTPTDPAVVAYRCTLRILGLTSAVAMDLALGFSL